MAPRETDGKQRPLIGVDRLAVPEWARLGEEVASAGFWRSFRAFPAAVRVIAVLAWQASPRLSVSAALAHAASGAVTAFGLLATTDLFTAFLAEGPTPARLLASLPAIGIVVGAYALKALLDAAVAAVEGTLRPMVARLADDAVTAVVTGAALVEFEDASFRELARRAATDGIDAIDSGVRHVARLISAAVTMTAALVTAGLLNPWLPLALAAVTVADGWAVGRVGRLNRRHFLDTVTRQMTKAVIADVTTSRRFAMERQVLGLRDRLLDEYRSVAHDLTASEVRLARRSALVRLSGRTVAGVGTVAAYGVLAWLLWAGLMPLALAGTAVLAMRTLASALAECLSAIDLLHEGTHHIELYRQVLAEGAARGPRRIESRMAPSDPEAIRLTAVSFSYPGQDTPALRDIDLTIRRGEVVALVGENGSGKTTLGKLVTGLYAPTTGTVTWDGVDLTEVDPGSVYDQVAVIAQAPAEWPTTAEVSVRIGRLEHDDHDGARWRTAAELSGSADILTSLPHRERTLLSRKFHEGQDLSGGQWQRLGIARGMYRDAHVLVADEPTSALDAKAEARVFAALRQAATTSSGARRTTIVVTHRLANISSADRIVVLSGGRIVEQGTHEELHRAGGIYHELFEIQASSYGVAN